MKKAIYMVMLVSLVASGCTSQTTSKNQPANSNQAGNQKQVGLANPASEYCTQHDGRLDIRTADDGSQTGYCVFTNGSECEEWSFFRGECKPADISNDIEQLFIQKYKKASDEVTVTVTQQDPTHARGSVKFGKNGIGEGGIFLAVKKENTWQLVFDGNGIIPCKQLEGYNFPKDMAPDCLNY